MDILAHGLWSYAAGSARRHNPAWRWQVFFGMFPDFIWLPATVYYLMTDGVIRFSAVLYDVSHSMVVFTVCVLIASLYHRRAAYVMWPWALHILMDIPGHNSSQLLFTPFLWPVSDFTIHGWWNWLSLPWLIVNYAVLVFVISGLLLRDYDRGRRS